MQMSWKKIVGFITITTIALCIGATAVTFNLQQARYAAALELTARQLGVQKDWEAVRHDIYCELFVPGRSIDEILPLIENQDSAVVSEDTILSTYRISFEDPYLQRSVGSIFVIVDEQRMVTEVSRNIGDDYVAVECPIIE
jgi:hypothetical protein